jgi:hypothetical protein
MGEAAAQLESLHWLAIVLLGDRRRLLRAGLARQQWPNATIVGALAARGVMLKVCGWLGRRCGVQGPYACKGCLPRPGR